MKVKVGIEKLDEKLKGGFPGKSSILVIGGPSFGKTVFCNQFIYQGLRLNEAAIYITFEAPPEKIKRKMKESGWDITGKIIIFIDAYSWKVGGTENKYVLNDIADLNEFNIKVLDAVRELQDKNLRRCAIDCVSELFSYVPSDLALKFILSLLTKLKRKAKTTQVITLEKGVHGPDVLSKLGTFTEGRIELDMRENERFLKIVKMKGIEPPSEWMKFEVGDKGIILRES